MKKILALVLSLVLMMGTATTAFAANDQYYGTGYMEATAYSYGTCEFETGKVGGSIVRGNVALRRGCGWKSFFDDTGKRYAGRS